MKRLVAERQRQGREVRQYGETNCIVFVFFIAVFSWHLLTENRKYKITPVSSYSKATEELNTLCHFVFCFVLFSATAKSQKYN